MHEHKIKLISQEASKKDYYRSRVKPNSSAYVLTFNSNTAIPIPLDAPDPAKPTKWPLPMLLANSEAPT